MAKKIKKEAKIKPETVLVLRTCAADMSAHGGFKWPAAGPVEAPDWKPTKECGHGLHGLLWGAGDGGYCDWSQDAKWVVVEVEKSLIIDLGDKIKFPRGNVVYSGAMKGAVEMLTARAPVGTPITGGSAVAGYRGSAVAGYRGLRQEICRDCCGVARWAELAQGGGGD